MIEQTEKRSHPLREMKKASISGTLATIAMDYPAGQIEEQRRDISRIAFNISLVAEQIPTDGRVADIGGGLGLFSPGCAELGLSAVLVDDFRDFGNIPVTEEVLSRVHLKRGVEVIRRDVINDGIEFPAESFDAVTTFDSMEHWHHSPKNLFRQLIAALKQNGLFVLAVPNCVNFRKRITVPFGRGKWSQMEEWYETKRFRGHVREPDVDDLRYIARDLMLVDVKIFGRNWLGYGSQYGWVQLLTPLGDRLLQVFPSFCSNIYLSGRKRI